ncbi:3'-5' exonuclease domain-containing protein [Plasmodiophora brassicae]|uniref:3'-5' exonuclease domain-containing protein n=1 Tax=Plasmodiophora brassicae TaxID=37360 RepID=A0A0G4IJX3_PLABS|nr:hypothetical protein PBRA_004195 [Plasmodiophora brassicae]
MKTVKMLTPILGGRTLNSMHKVTNEDVMIRSFTFQMGSGHNDEVEPVVSGICKSLSSYGYALPIIWNTDRFHTDRAMLERVCPSLLRSARSSARSVDYIADSPLAQPITDMVQLVALANSVLADLSSVNDSDAHVLSLDCEWNGDNTAQCDVLGLSSEFGQSKGAFAVQIDRVFAKEKGMPMAGILCHVLLSNFSIRGVCSWSVKPFMEI